MNQSPKSQCVGTLCWEILANAELRYAFFPSRFLTYYFSIPHLFLSKAFVMATCPSPEEGWKHSPLRSSLALNPAAWRLERDAEHSLSLGPGCSHGAPFCAETSPLGCFAWQPECIDVGGKAREAEKILSSVPENLHYSRNTEAKWRFGVRVLPIMVPPMLVSASGSDQCQVCSRQRPEWVFWGAQILQTQLEMEVFF